MTSFQPWWYFPGLVAGVSIIAAACFIAGYRAGRGDQFADARAYLDAYNAGKDVGRAIERQEIEARKRAEVIEAEIERSKRLRDA